MTTIAFATSPPVTVIVPVRLDAPVLAVVLSNRALFPEPLVGETVNQVALLVAVQATLEVTETLVLFDAEPGDQVEEPKVRLAAGIPACVTAMVLVRPPPVTVMVPQRLEVVVFANTLTVRAPLLDSLAGETVNQDTTLLEAVQLTFEVTATLVAFAVDPIFNSLVLRVRLAVGTAPA